MDDKASEKGLRLFDGHFNPIIWIDLHSIFLFHSKNFN